MVIDILPYTEEQLGQLNERQLLEIKKTQHKKNKLTRALQKDKDKAKRDLINGGMFFSGIWEKQCQRLDEVYEEEVDVLKETLLYFLHFTSSGGSTVGYPVDYTLSMLDRATIVKNYYESTYSDVYKRWEAFEKDEVAPEYLGDYYATLHDYFKADVI